MRPTILLALMLALVVGSSPAIAATVGSACVAMGDASACTPPVDTEEPSLPLGPVHEASEDPENLTVGEPTVPGPEDVGVPSEDELRGALPAVPEAPDTWEGPTFPVGRCLATQEDAVGRVVCVAETPFITVSQVLWLLGGDLSG